MILTKEKAIEIAIELWTFLAETGEQFKRSWPGWEKYEAMDCHCPLCEYAYREALRTEKSQCFFCPYDKMFGGCCYKGSPYDMWEGVKTKRAKKKYASLFLEQLKQL